MQYMFMKNEKDLKEISLCKEGAKNVKVFLEGGFAVVRTILSLKERKPLVQCLAIHYYLRCRH